MTNTLFVGKVYLRFDELPSTNDRAAELLAKSKPPEGTVVRADSQSAGRGQFGSRWESAAGQNLTLSVILYPNWLEAQQQFYLSMAVALGVKDAAFVFDPTPNPSPTGRGDVERNEASGMNKAGGEEAVVSSRPPLPTGEGPGVGLKWPNDLYLGPRKAGGILIQNSISGAFLQSSIVGIGLNVNQLAFDPALPNPTSLAAYFGRPFDLDAVADRLFECLERRYLQLKSGQHAAIKAEYEQSLFRLGEPAQFVRSADDTSFEGIIRGVTESGRLRIQTAAGEEVFDLKEVRYLL